MSKSLLGQMFSLTNWSVRSWSTWECLLLKLLEFHLELQMVMCYKISKLYLYQSDLENPNSATNDWITFHLWSYSKLLSSIILHLTKIKKINNLKKKIVSPKLKAFFIIFCFLQYSNFTRKLGSLKWNNYDIMKWII